MVIDMIDYLKKCEFQRLGVEVPFNHYGERGWVDIWLVHRDFTKKIQYWAVAEVKPEICNLNETIRQLNCAKVFFFQDKKVLLEGWENIFIFLLIVESSEQNFKTFLKYGRYFQNIDLIFFAEAKALKKRI